MSLSRQFEALFPIGPGDFELALVEVGPERPAGLVATVRTIVWDSAGPSRAIRDIKEQELVWLLARHRDDPRVPAYLTGWAEALRFVLARHAELRAAGELPLSVAQRLEFAMPHELFCPQLLDLRRPTTAEAFTDALLLADKRLGRLVP